LANNQAKQGPTFSILIWKLESNITGDRKYLNVKVNLTTSRTESYDIMSHKRHNSPSK